MENIGFYCKNGTGGHIIYGYVVTKQVYKMGDTRIVRENGRMMAFIVHCLYHIEEYLIRRLIELRFRLKRIRRQFIGPDKEAGCLLGSSGGA